MSRLSLTALSAIAAAVTTGWALPARQENPSVSARSPLTKAVTKKTYAHIMPWFETPQTNGSWGIHWTMANQNPNNMDGSGRRQIASYYYPLIGPYGSGDKDVVEYQLLLMKYSGIDGVLIDWPGTINAWDYPKNRQNAEAIIAGAQKLGLEFGIVYEDNNIRLTSNAGVWSGDWLAQARSDMAYIRDNYFPSSNYIKVNGAPVLLDFGPQAFQNPSDWNNILSVFSQKPTFLTLWYMSQYAGSNANGEFCWIYSDFTTGLANFYNNRALGAKFGVGYPGFNAFYSAGGWDGPTFTLPHDGTGTFGQTLDLALNSGVQQIQLATWNDYGEGTMIEPTREFGYGFLTTLQLKLGVPYSQAELELVNTLYQQRKQYSGDATKQASLDQAAAAFAALNVVSAKDILNGGSGNTATTIPAKIAASAYSSMSGIQTETCSEGGLDVGWTDPNDYMVYPIKVTTSGSYTIQYRVASGASGGSFATDLNDGATQLGAITVPATGGWQAWTTVSQVVTLDAGSYNFRVLSKSTGWNLGWINFVSGSGSQPSAPLNKTLKNVANGMYAYREGSVVKYTSDPTPYGAAAQWTFEDYSGYKRIRNVGNSCLMHIEHLYAYAECDTGTPDGWYSNRWTFMVGSNYVFNNAWQGTQLNLYNNPPAGVQCTARGTSADAQWIYSP